MLRSAIMLLLFVSSLAVAQRLSFNSSGLVRFSPSGSDLAANDATLLPDSTSPEISFRVQRQGAANPILVQAVRQNWTPTNNLQLEARFEGSTSPPGSFDTGWILLDDIAQTILDSNFAVANIRVSYRLRLSGSELPGVYTTSMRFWAGTSELNHDLRVTIPSFLSLRLNSTSAGQPIFMHFDYSQERSIAYLEAIREGHALAVSSSNLTSVELASNNPNGYSLQITASPSPLAPKLRVQQLPLSDWRYLGSGATEGYIRVLQASDFSLLLDGSEAPGRYSILLTYQLVPRP